MNNCILCNEDGGEVIIRNTLFRIVYVVDENYPGFVRLILNEHVQEQSDLNDDNSICVFKVLAAIERIIRNIYNPDKINLASLGNVVPHLHWHIIPRYKNDTHFPNPIWGEITNPEYISNKANLKDSLFTHLKDAFKHYA